MSLRRLDGFCRYACAVQYHGAPFLGFSYQGPDHEDTVLLENGTDLRGYVSVEGRIRSALDRLVGTENYENVQVSSRTDRGVHALRNTYHVDIRPRSLQTTSWDARNIHRGLNYHLSRAPKQQETVFRKRRRGSVQPTMQQYMTRDVAFSIPDVRILSVARAPLSMPNKFAHEHNQPSTIDWSARFSATQRTYVYRILNMVGDERDYGVPFEWDRSWRICSDHPLDVTKMTEASQFLQGSHDFTSFRGSSCQRQSSIVTMHDVRVFSQPYNHATVWNGQGGLLGLGCDEQDSNVNIVTVTIVGESFLYRQVRNMVGCLVNVGLGKMSPKDVRMLLDERNRAMAPAMAPAHGLFLVNVEHGDFVF